MWGSLHRTARDRSVEALSHGSPQSSARGRRYRPQECRWSASPRLFPLVARWMFLTVACRARMTLRNEQYTLRFNARNNRGRHCH